MAFNSLRKRACGTWQSPLAALHATQVVTSIEDVIVDSVTGAFYHIENRPSEEGRSVLVDSLTGRDVVEQTFDVKTLVNSYGRAAATIRDGVLYFNNAADHRVYRQPLPSISAIPITPANEPFRFAFFIRHPIHNNIIFTVKEDHSIPTASGIVTTLAYIDSIRATVHTLASGADFYVNPTVNASGTKLAWMEWNHPHMQWKGSQLFVADICFHNNGALSLVNRQLIAGDPGRNAVFQFAWCPPDYNSDIVLTWDKTPFCEPWVYISGEQGTQQLKAVFGQPNSIQSDFSDPTWWLDDSSFVFLDDTGFMLWVATKEGRSQLNFLNITTGELQPIPNPYLEITRVRRIDSCTVVFIGTTATRSASLIRMTIDRQWASPAPSFDIIFSPPEVPVQPTMIPHPKSYKIPKRNGQFTYAHFYPPTNPSYAPLDSEKPPCLISLHSGPTIRTQVGFQLLRLYYTSRGFAWVDIDYCGSTGYGKEYRNRLEGQYGVLDVEDILAATEYLSLLNIFDRRRVCLRTTAGGSFPALQVFTKHPDIFVAAAAHFMVADLSAAARDNTEKPTRFYLTSLMGGTPEEIPEVYRARNPVLHADRITRPLLVTHVRTAATFRQAESIVRTVSGKGGHVEYLFFEPGLPRPTMLAQVLEHELSFFQKILT